MKRLAVCLVFIGAASTLCAAAQSSDAHYFSDMRWRHGPTRKEAGPRGLSSP